MKRWSLVMILLAFISGCSLQAYDVQTVNKKEIMIPQDAFHLAGQRLTTLEKSKWEEASIVYYAKDELELAKIIQYSLDMDRYEIAYQSNQDIDIEKVVHILGFLNPFDLSIIQNDITYTNAFKDELYKAHHIRIQILDERYALACEEAKRRVEKLITEDMSTETRIKVIHDDIILHSVYDDTVLNNKADNPSFYQSAGVLLDGRGVCTGYSRAFMLMAKYADVSSIYVSSEAMNHSWNYVYDGQAWRYIDVTWDDPLPDQGLKAQQTFFIMSEAAFLQEGSHVLSKQEKEEVETIANCFF